MTLKTSDEKIAWPEEIVSILAEAGVPQPIHQANGEWLPIGPRETKLAENYRLLFSLQYLLCLRVSEALLLRPEHLVPGMRGDLRWVRVPTLKQYKVLKSEARAPKPPPLIETPVLWGDAVVLYAFDAERCKGSPWLFPSRRDPKRHLFLEDACREFKSIVRRCPSVRDCLSTHSLRHASATAVAVASGSDSLANAFLRHTPKGATQVYLHKPAAEWAKWRGCLRLPSS